MTSEVPFSGFIAPSADPPRRESKLGLWEGGLLATLPTWTKHRCRSPSVVAKPTLTIGECSVWVRGGASGLDKRQCTVQLTLFGDGEPRVKPLLIFRGKGKRIALS